jgi:hypothetical protein
MYQNNIAAANLPPLPEIQIDNRNHKTKNTTEWLFHLLAFLVLFAFVFFAGVIYGRFDQKRRDYVVIADN